MPRKRRSQTQNRVLGETLDVDVTETHVTSSGPDLSDTHLNITESELEEKLNEAMQMLQIKKELALKELDFAFKTALCKIPENILNTPMKLNDKALRNIFEKLENNDERNENTPIAPTTVKRRRSRSVKAVNHFGLGSKKLDVRSNKKRSSSLDPYKTPINKVCLSALTSVKKYTVSKPARVEDSGISLKRIMKPNEEAISISGSPLLVHPSVATEPCVNIPLPGGVVMNIEPKKPRGNVKVLDLDERTKQQLKMLCEQLNNML